MTMTALDNDIGSVTLADAKHDDVVFTSAGAGTVLAGTIMAMLTATGKYVVYLTGGGAGAGIASAVLTHDYVSSGAGDKALRLMKSGGVRQERLIIAADGDGSNVDFVELQSLQDFGIYSQKTPELNIADNQ